MSRIFSWLGGPHHFALLSQVGADLVDIEADSGDTFLILWMKHICLMLFVISKVSIFLFITYDC